jgi:hypothetical protein
MESLVPDPIQYNIYEHLRLHVSPIYGYRQGIPINGRMREFLKIT